jgi:peptidoglycan/LPS O-acetylase OafA/YrhL
MSAAASSDARLEPEHYRFIDALRGWAILLVILTHAAQGQFAADALGEAAPQSAVLALPFWLQAICAAAGSGVHLFFVVSALSLALSWRARSEPGWAAYLIRRFWRIAPMFYAGILLYLFLYGFRPRLYAPQGITPQDVALTFGFMHGWSMAALNSVVPGDWSIAAEAMFYVILPPLLILGRTPRRLAFLMIGFVLMAQLSHWLQPGFGPLGNAGFPSQAAVFLFGLAAAQAMDRPVPARGAAALAVFGFLCFGLPLLHLPEAILAYQLQFGALAGLLCVLLHRAKTPLLVNEPLIRLGRISFSIYILHFALLAPVLAAARDLVSGASDVVLLAVYYPLLVAIAASSASGAHTWIERPGIRFGRFLVAQLERRRLAAPRGA